MLGLSAGYLVARDAGWDSGEDWKPLVYGTGIGALSGGVLGLTLGIVDMARDTPGLGAIVLRDTVYGTAFGAGAGAIVGTLFLVSSKEPEHILLGASIGALVGAGAGVALGIVEGNRSRARRAPVTAALAPLPDLAGRLVWMPAVQGRY
jgi:hypothetical protein